MIVVPVVVILTLLLTLILGFWYYRYRRQRGNNIDDDHSCGSFKFGRQSSIGGKVARWFGLRNWAMSKGGEGRGGERVGKESSGTVGSNGGVRPLAMTRGLISGSSGTVTAQLPTLSYNVPSTSVDVVVLGSVGKALSTPPLFSSPSSCSSSSTSTPAQSPHALFHPYQYSAPSPTWPRVATATATASGDGDASLAGPGLQQVQGETSQQRAFYRLPPFSFERVHKTSTRGVGGSAGRRSWFRNHAGGSRSTLSLPLQLPPLYDLPRVPSASMSFAATRSGNTLGSATTSFVVTHDGGLGAQRRSVPLAAAAVETASASATTIASTATTPAPSEGLEPSSPSSQGGPESCSDDLYCSAEEKDADDDDDGVALRTSADDYSADSTNSRKSSGGAVDSAVADSSKKKKKKQTSTDSTPRKRHYRLENRRTRSSSPHSLHSRTGSEGTGNSAATFGKPRKGGSSYIEF
jgi:hypothetical protein